MQPPPPEQQASAPIQCIKCGAPLGTGGGRCPFCGTEQPKTGPQGGAAFVGLTDVQRARMGRSMPPKKASSNTGLVIGLAAAGIGALLLVGGAAMYFLSARKPETAPAATTSARPAPPPARSIGGIAVEDAARVDPTDLLPQIKKSGIAWNGEAKLHDIQVVQAKNGFVNVVDPGGEVIVRYIVEKVDPRQPKGKDRTVQRMQFTVKANAPAPEQSAGSPADRAVAEPNCVWGAAHRSAVKAGMKPEGPVDARYAFEAKYNDAVWTFTAGGTKYVVDGNSCAVKAN